MNESNENPVYRMKARLMSELEKCETRGDIIRYLSHTTQLYQYYVGELQKIRSVKNGRIHEYIGNGQMGQSA